MTVKLIVVDDEPQVLKTIKNVFEPLGCEVMATSNSREAMKLVAKEKFDGILLNAGMPEVDGFELTETVRASRLNGGVPVVMLTGYDDIKTMRKGFRSGITFFLGKPFTQERMLRLFRALKAPAFREKRLHARLPYRGVVHWSCGNRSGKAISINLSEAGMLMEPTGELALGDEVTIEFSLPKSHKVHKILAIAIRQELPERIAVRFQSLTHEARSAIQSYISGLARK